MALNIWIWVTAIVVAMFSIVFVWMIMYFLIPMKNSPARHFVKAKRDKKPIVLLDAGKYWRCVIGKDKVGEEKAQIIRSGQDVIKGSQGLKFCEGVMLGVAEDFRSLLVNIGIIDLMEMINKKGWNQKDVQERLTTIADNIKKDLGFTDEIQELDNNLKEDIKEINVKYGNERADILRNYRMPDKEETHDRAESSDLPGGSEQIEGTGKTPGE